MSYQIKTMKLSGNDYAPVDERLRAFHEDNKNSSIQNSIQFLDGKIIQATCKIVPDVSNPERFFTASSYGELGKQKAYEKLETIAVGRALAFAGYLADGKIASFEEMENFEKSNQTQNSYQKLPNTPPPKLPVKTDEEKAVERLILKLKNNQITDFENTRLWLLNNEAKLPKELLNKALDLINEKEPKIEVNFDPNYVN